MKSNAARVQAVCTLHDRGGLRLPEARDGDRLEPIIVALRGANLSRDLHILSALVHLRQQDGSEQQPR